jgi:hypothetical protein
VAAIVATDYWMTHGKIYRGVSVGGVTLGGKTPEEAQRILQERTGGFEEIEPAGPEKFTVSTEQLGVDFDVRSSANRAYTVGRQGNVFERVSDRMEATWGTVSVPLAVDYERGRLRDALSGVVHWDERKASLPNQEADKRQGQFRGDRQAQVTQHDEHEDADVPEGVDDVGGPSRKICEQLTHPVSSTNLRYETVLVPNT